MFDHVTLRPSDRAASERGYDSASRSAPGIAPEERPVCYEGYYGALVLDPDGNDVEVVNHNR